MAVVLRSTKGSALTHTELDGNFSDYSTFKALFKTTEFSGSNDGQFLFWNNSTSKVEVKSLESSDITDAVTVQFNSLLATKTTAHLTEGANLYYTDARVDTRIGALDTNSLSEGSNNLYYTNARVDARLNSILSTKTTNDISEGSNLYYTDGRVDARFNTRSITSLLNVDDVTSSDNGKILYYNHGTTSFKWKSDTAATNLTALTDVDAVTSLNNGQILYYNHGTSSFKWKSLIASTDELVEGSSNLYFTNARFDTRLASKNTSSLNEGSNLYFTNERVDDRVASLIVAGTNISKTYNDVGGTLTLDVSNAGIDARIAAAEISDLTNVHTAAPTDGQALVWDNANSYWKPATVSGGGAAGDITAVIAGTGLTGGGSTGSVTLQADVGTSANKIVQLDGSAKLPAVDGSQLTNVALTGNTTANLTEGSNLYFTNARADARADARIAAADTDALSEGSSNLYFTNARVQAVSINNVSEDTTPELGGNLNVGTHEIQSADVLKLATTNATGEVNFRFGGSSLASFGQQVTNNVTAITSTIKGLAIEFGSDTGWFAGSMNFSESGVVGSVEGQILASSSGDLAVMGDIDFSSGVLSGEMIGNAYVDHPTNKSMYDGLVSATIDGVTQQFAYTGADVPFYIEANSGNANASSIVIGHPTDNRIHILNAAGNTIYKLPATDGTAGQKLTTNGSGDLYWS